MAIWALQLKASLATQLLCCFKEREKKIIDKVKTLNQPYSKRKLLLNIKVFSLHCNMKTQGKKVNVNLPSSYKKASSLNGILKAVICLSSQPKLLHLTFITAISKSWFGNIKVNNNHRPNSFLQIVMSPFISYLEQSLRL